MSKEIEVIAWCDGPHDKRVRAGRDYTITMDGGKPTVIDLCDQCVTTFIEPVASMLQVGAEVKGSVAKSYGCPVCTFASPTPQGLGKHARSAHGATVTELRNTASGSN